MRKKMIGRCALMLLIAALMLSCLPAFAAAEPVDIADECSVTIHLAGAPVESEAAEETDAASPEPSADEEEEIQAELTAAAVQMDIYKIADAEEVSGNDAYNFVMTAPFESLSIEDDMGTEGARALAEEAAALAADAEPTVVATKEAGAVEVTADGLSAGLYLILPHTEGDPALTVKTTRYAYTFSPILVSLPTKSSTYTGVVKTSDTGDWIYDVNVYLKDKYNVEDRLGCFVIEKTIQGLVDDGVTVIFDVSVTMNGEPCEEYNNIYSMYFADHTQPTGTLLVTGIPVGAVVTVTEVYAGGGYRQVASDNTQIEITTSGSAAEQSSGTASFTNAKTGPSYPGGSVTNLYTEVESEMEGQFTWHVEQKAGNVTVSADAQ